jgi:peptide/nickel transport system substrate-binding protein
MVAYSRRHPNENLSILATSKGSWNATHWANATFDKAIATAREASSLDEQKAAYAEAQQLMATEDGHVMPIFGAYVSAHSSKVKGLKLDFVQQTDFSEATVS